MKHLLWILIPVAGAAGAAGPQADWRPVRGGELQALIADHELGDDVHYAYQFHRGGSITGTDMGKPARGTWRVSGRALCWTWHAPASPEECYEVERQGPLLRFLKDGYERGSGTLTPIETVPSKKEKP